MLLGLDFLVCKDLIDTLLLDSGAEFWRDLAGLSIIVCIRIVLSVLAQKEIHELERVKDEEA